MDSSLRGGGVQEQPPSPLFPPVRNTIDCQCQGDHYHHRYSYYHYWQYYTTLFVLKVRRWGTLFLSIPFLLSSLSFLPDGLSKRNVYLLCITPLPRRVPFTAPVSPSPSRLSSLSCLALLFFFYLGGFLGDASSLLSVWKDQRVKDNIYGSWKYLLHTFYKNSDFSG